MKKKIFIVAAVFTSSHLIAQDSTSKTLDEVIITANKFPQKESGTGKVVTVITHEQIMQSGGKDLSQLLNEQNGVIVNGATSNPGKDKSLFMLGATSGYTLLLLDGVPLNDPSGVGGTFDLRLLSLDNIERIEILKGSQSTLYGSNAVAGVINIISKKPAGSKPVFKGLATYGSFNSFKGNANLSQKIKWIDYDLNYVYNRTDGISEAKDTSGTGNFDKDGYTQHSIQALVGIHVTDHLKISPYYRFTQFKGGYDADAFMDAPNQYSATLVNTGLTGDYVYNTGTLHVNYAYDLTKRDYLSQFPEFATKGKFNQAEAYVDQRLNQEIQMVAGIDFQSFSMDNRDTVNSMISPYASLLFSVQQFHLEVASRFNHHNLFGDNFNYSLNPSYLVNGKIKLFVNLSTGFRPPSVNEMLPSQYQLENFDLKPEKSINLEAGIQTWLVDKRLSFLATYFNRHLKDAIVYTTDPATFKGLYLNRDKQNDYGAEFELKYQSQKNLYIQVSYAYITGKGTEKTDAGKDTTFYNLIRRPKNNVHFMISYHINPNFLVSSSLQFTGKRTDSYFDPVSFHASEVDLKSYALWNLYAEYAFLNKKLSIFIDAKNLTDNKKYYEIYGFSVAGFTATGGIRFQL